MSKKFLITLSIIVLILLLAAVLLFSPFFLGTPEDRVVEEFNSDTSMFSRDGQSPIIGGFDAVVEDTEYVLIQTKFDIFNPEYAFILKSNVSNSTTTWLIKMERNGILYDWSILEYRLVRFEFGIEETQKILIENNLFETNPDPENIFVVPQQ